MDFSKLKRFFENIGKTYQETDNPAYDMLEKSLTESLNITECDGGTLYLKKTVYSKDRLRPFDKVDEYLDFEVVQNKTLDVFRRSDRDEMNIKSVPLFIEGKPNHKNVSSYCFNTDKIVNVKDVYANDQFDFSGVKFYDKNFGYNSRSMLVLPIKGRTGQNMGVFQLINKKDADGNSIPFSDEDSDIMYAISLILGLIFSTQNLYIENKMLIDSMISMIAKNIEEKSPHTSEHIQRVTELSGMIAKAMTENNRGIYADVFFDNEKMEKIRKAGLLHDIGKVAVPEHYLSKEVKLQTVTDRFELLAEKFNSILKDAKIQSLEKKLTFLEKKLAGSDSETQKDYSILESKENVSLAEMQETLFSELQTISNSNKGGEFMTHETKEIIDRVCSYQYEVYFETENENLAKINRIKNHRNSVKKTIVSDWDKENLRINKGTLNRHEREVITNHAKQTWDLLLSLQLPNNMRDIAKLAGSHHEALDGTGYPFKMTWESMETEIRIIAVADILEALSSRSRPYRQAFKTSEFMTILGKMVKEGKIDGEILLIFIRSDYFQHFIKTMLLDYQDDAFDIEEWKTKFYVSPNVI